VENDKKIVYYIMTFIGALGFFLFLLEQRIEAKTDASQFQPIPFSIVATIIGGVIILTLTYVSWKKYKAEKKRENKNDNS